MLKNLFPSPSDVRALMLARPTARTGVSRLLTTFAAAAIIALPIVGCGDEDAERIETDAEITTATDQTAGPQGAPPSPQEMLAELPEAEPTGWEEFDRYHVELENLYAMVTSGAPLEEARAFRKAASDLAAVDDPQHEASRPVRENLEQEVDRYFADLETMEPGDRVARIHPIFALSTELARSADPPYESHALRIETMMHGLHMALERMPRPEQAGEEEHGPIVVPPGAAPGVLLGE